MRQQPGEGAALVEAFQVGFDMIIWEVNWQGNVRLFSFYTMINWDHLQLEERHVVVSVCGMGLAQTQLRYHLFLPSSPILLSLVSPLIVGHSCLETTTSEW